MERCTHIHETDHNDNGDLEYTFLNPFHVTKSEHEKINMFVARCNYTFVKSDSDLYNTHVNI